MTSVTHSTLVSNVSLIQAAVLIASTSVSVHYQAVRNNSSRYYDYSLEKDASASFLFNGYQAKRDV
ncbi:hypothetical protein VDIAB_30041 [Vibrio diabolicus]|nr:hypothetical protein VDIAB_30041 [Vibrio diabolicus]